MYGYYALRAARVHVPRVLAQTITSLQISQMVSFSGEFCVDYW